MDFAVFVFAAVFVPVLAAVLGLAAALVLDSVLGLAEAALVVFAAGFSSVFDLEAAVFVFAAAFVLAAVLEVVFDLALALLGARLGTQVSRTSPTLS